MSIERGDYTYKESGLDNVILSDWKIYVCAACGTRLPVMPDARALARALTKLIVSKEAKLNGDEILFLRKAMRLTAELLAQMLGVSRVEVSRWENKRNPINNFADFRLRLLAIHRVLPSAWHRETRDEVERILEFAYKEEEVTRRPVRIPAQKLEEEFAFA